VLDLCHNKDHSFQRFAFLARKPDFASKPAKFSSLFTILTALAADRATKFRDFLPQVKRNYTYPPRSIAISLVLLPLLRTRRTTSNWSSLPYGEKLLALIIRHVRSEHPGPSS